VRIRGIPQLPGQVHPAVLCITANLRGQCLSWVDAVEKVQIARRRGLSRRNALWGQAVLHGDSRDLALTARALTALDPLGRPFGTLTRASCWQNLDSMID